MERQARFLRMGMLVLAFAAAVLASIYWLHGVANLGATAVYVVRFDGAAPGVEVGSSVLFDGVRVGEVTKIAFDPRDPNEVFATIRISRTTPVRADTRVGVDTLGPMGGGLISLHGGGAASPPPSGVGGATPVLTADPALVVGLGETARAVLQRVDKLVAENSDPLHSTLSNLEVFSDALSRNSGRVDSILQGLERMTGGGPPKSSTPMYDLAAPTSFPPFKKLLTSLAIAEPTAMVMYDSQHPLFKSKDGGFTPFEDALWSDSLLKLVQAKLVQASRTRDCSPRSAARSMASRPRCSSSWTSEAFACRSRIRRARTRDRGEATYRTTARLSPRASFMARRWLPPSPLPTPSRH